MHITKAVGFGFYECQETHCFRAVKNIKWNLGGFLLFTNGFELLYMKSNEFLNKNFNFLMICEAFYGYFELLTENFEYLTKNLNF